MHIQYHFSTDVHRICAPIMIAAVLSVAMVLSINCHCFLSLHGVYFYASFTIFYLL